MLIKLMLALVGGTVISLIFGYIVAYWRDMADKPLRSSQRDEREWFKLFDRLSKIKGEAFRFSSHQKPKTKSSKAQSERAKKAPNSWANHPELLRLTSQFEEFFPSLYRYFSHLLDQAPELIALEANELSRRLKTKVSSSFMADRFNELLHLRSFDSYGAQEKGPEEVRELWQSFGAAHLFLNDARFGTGDLTQSYAKELHLSEADIFRGIEIQLLLAQGASKKAIFKKYWESHQKKPYVSSEYLQQMPPSKREVLALKWVQLKGGLSVEQLGEQLKETILEVEKAFQQFYQKANTKSESSKSKSKSKSREQKQRKERFETKPPPNSDQWAYDLLEMQSSEDYLAIKKQFRKMAMKYHPDRLAREGASEKEIKRHHEYFVEVQKAFQHLEKRYSKKAA